MCAYRLLPHRGQNWLLLAASYYFYAAWDWRFLGLLIASTVVDFTCARALARTTAPGRRRAFLVLSLGFNLSLLGFSSTSTFLPTACTTLWRPRLEPRLRDVADPAARRHLLLYVRDDELRHRRVSP